MCMKKFDAEKNIFWQTYRVFNLAIYRSVRVAERLALPTSDHGVAGSNPAEGEILPEPKRRFIAQSLSCSPFHRLEMTEILLKGRKTLTHPSIGHLQITASSKSADIYFIQHFANIHFSKSVCISVCRGYQVSRTYCQVSFDLETEL